MEQLYRTAPAHPLVGTHPAGCHYYWM